MTTEYKAGDTYEFPCGCKFSVLGPNPNGGIPLLDIDNNFFHHKIPYNCPKTWKLFEEGLTTGVFQLEKSLGKHWSKQIKPKSIDDLGAIGALLRPGCLESKIDGKSMTQLYADRKNGISPTPPYQAHVDRILKKTFGTLVFQEQAMFIAQEIAGFSLREADMLRKACGKKDTAEMAKVKTMFIEGAKRLGIVSNEMAEQIFGWIEKSQRYSFNASHAISYGVNGYWSAYLKTHFPVYFFTSYLKHAKNKQDTYDEIKRLVEDAKMFNIRVLPPDIRSEETEFYTNGRDVCFGLVDVKGIGAGTFEKARETIAAGEATLGKSVSDMNWFEFLCFVGYDVKKTIVESAIRAGAMDCFNEPRQQMLFDYSCISELTAKEITLLRTKLLESPESLGSMTLVEALRIAAPTKKEGGITHSVTRKQKVLDTINLLENPPRKLVDTAFSRNKDEQEMLGIGLTACAVDSCSRELANASCKDILLCRGDELIVAVEIANVRQFLTKVKKEKMAYLTVTDETGTADNVVVFPSAFVDCSDMLYQGNTVMLFGYCQTERNSFVAERCIQI